MSPTSGPSRSKRRAPGCADRSPTSIYSSERLLQIDDEGARGHERGEIDLRQRGVQCRGGGDFFAGLAAVLRLARLDQAVGEEVAAETDFPEAPGSNSGAACSGITESAMSSRVWSVTMRMIASPSSRPGITAGHCLSTSASTSLNTAA